MSSSTNVDGSRDSSQSDAGSSRWPRSAVSVACTACKERKSKCDGPPGPCTSCIGRGTFNCVFDAESDKRRKLAKKLKRERADFHQTLQTGLIETIRTCDEGTVDGLINRIRGGASPCELLRYTNNCLAAGPRSLENTSDNGSSGQTGTPQLPGKTPAGRNVLEVRELVRPWPLFFVSARPWTSVEVEDRTVSELMSVYFMWWNPLHRPIEQEPFIKSMSKGDPDSPLCSSYLVNMLLAFACGLHHTPGAIHRSKTIEVLEQRFYQEATRLWTAEESKRPTLTNLQALFTLSTYTVMRGLDKIRILALKRLVEMHKVLGLSATIPTVHASEDEKADIHRSFKTVSWAVFNMVTAASCLIPTDLGPPSFGLPYDEDEGWQSEMWTPYPDHAPRQSLLRLAFNEYCKLRVICWKGVSTLRPTDTGNLNLVQDNAETILDEMECWHQSLPEPLKQRPGLESPIIEVHMLYFIARTVIFDLLKQPPLTPISTPQSADREAAIQQRRVSHILDILPLTRIYRDEYGLSFPVTAICQITAVALPTLMRSLNNEENCAAFTELIPILIAGARRWNIWKGILYTIRPVAKELGVGLPQDAEVQIKMAESHFWSSKDYQRHEADYPIYALVRDAQKNEEHGLGDLLENGPALNVEEMN